MRRRACLILALLTVAAPTVAAPARAAAAPGPGPPPTHSANRSPYEVDLTIDLTISIGAMAAAVTPRLFVDEYLAPPCGLACDRDDVNAFDRPAIGNRSATLDAISTAGTVVSGVLPAALLAIDVAVSDPADGWTGYGVDLLVLAETASVTYAISNVLNLAVRRPRPYAYDPSVSAAERLGGEAALSFPSGHTAGAFAMATAYSRLFMLRHPDSPLVVPVWVGTYAIAGTTGVLRVQSGDHFWTDVIAGAALGVTVGLVVPYLHERRAACGSARTPALRFAPLVLPGGGLGAALAFQ